LEAQKAFLDEMGRNLGVEGRAGWYKVTNKLLVDNGGSGLLKRYHGSLQKILSAVYSDFVWDPLKFPKAPQNYWSSLDNQRAFLEGIALKNGVDLNDRASWYKVTTQVIMEHGGRVLLSKYNYSISALLAAVYPDYQWDVLQFSNAPHTYWASADNQRKFMNEMAVKLGFNPEDMESWYRVTNQTLLDNGASALLKKHEGSLFSLFSAVFPEHKWDPLKFSQAPRNYWNSIDNQRNFMDELGRSLGMKEGNRDGWYVVTSRTVNDAGGNRLLGLYNGSLPLLLSKVYPEYNWNMWKFPRRASMGKGLSRDKAGLLQILSSMEQELNVQSPQDWYRITYEHYRTFGIAHLYKTEKTIMLDALKTKYPEEKWDESLLFRKQKAVS